MATPVYVSSTGNGAVTAGTTVAATFGSALSAANYLICGVYWAGAAATCTVSDSVNGAWTAIGSPQTGTGGMATYRFQMFRFASSAAGTPTVTATASASGSDRAIMALAYDASAGIDSSAYLNIFTNLTTSGASVTPGAVNQMVVAFAAPANRVVSVASPYTIRQSGVTVNYCGAADTAGTSGVASAASWTSNINSDMITGAAVLQANAGGGGGSIVNSRPMMGVGG